MKKKPVKKTSKKSKGRNIQSTIYGIEQEFLIISGGGLVVIVVLLTILFH